MKTVLSRLHQIAAIAMLVLASSLAWRTAIQPAIVYNDHFHSAIAKGCFVADGCAGIYKPSVRYDERIGAWVPVVRIALGKGKRDTALIDKKIRAAIDEAANSGAGFLKAARQNAGVALQ